MSRCARRSRPCLVAGGHDGRTPLLALRMSAHVPAGVGIELGLGRAHLLEVDLEEAVAAARNTRSNRRVLHQYEKLDAPTIGLLSTTPPIDPRNLASPKEKTPPSDAMVQ